MIYCVKYCKYYKTIEDLHVNRHTSMSLYDNCMSWYTQVITPTLQQFIESLKAGNCFLSIDYLF